MFTGIIETTGTLESLAKKRNSMTLVIKAPDMDFSDVKTGDSIAVSGVCLTVTKLSEKSFTADVSPETLNLTSLGQLGSGDEVNLEKALRLGDRLGGHMVSGHVDGLCVLDSIRPDGNAVRMRFGMPKSLAAYVARKGSVTIDGISLTVNSVDDVAFEVAVIPHTLEKTTLGHIKPGQKLNLEVDLVARYLERMVSHGNSPELSLETLKKNGFA